MPKPTPAPTRRFREAAGDIERHFAKLELLSSAIGVFSKHGIEATRIEDILEASRVSRRTFYKYFSSKNDVLAALYDEATAQLLRVVRFEQEEKGPSIASLRKGIDLYLDYH